MNSLRSLLLGSLLLSCLASAAPPQTVNAWVSRNVAPGNNIRLVINTRNVPVVGVVAYGVDGETWLRRPHGPNDLPSPVGKPRVAWSLTVAQPGQYTNAKDNYFSRQVNLPIHTPGVYLLRISGGGAQTACVVNVTNLAVIVKRSTTQGLAWVTDHRTRHEVRDATVTYYDKNGERLASGQTRGDGTLLLPLPLSTERVVIRRGNDLAGIEARGASFDGQLKALFQTDRPIYRPGQTVFFKAVLRTTDGQGYRPVASSDVVIRLRDPRDNPLDELHLRSNDMGTVSGSFKIPLEGMMGAYTLGLVAAGQPAFQTITVAAYRKPEFKVEASPAAKRYLAGEDLAFQVKAAYYFGAPVPQAAVRWVARRNPLYFGYGGDEQGWFYGGDGNLYPRDTYASQPFVGEGTVYTDNQGNVTIPLKTDPEWPDATYSIQVTVTDGSRRQVEGSASVPVYSATLRLALSSDRQTVAQGELIPVKIRIVDLDGNPQPGTVALQLVQQVWNEKQGKFERKILTATTAHVPATGTAQVNLPALAQGDLTVEAKLTDPTGRVAKASLTAYVFEPGYVPEKEEEQPRLELRLDKRVYSPGQTAHAFVESNHRDPVLLVLEGREIWDYKVVAGRAVWSFPTSTKLSPNAFVSAQQWVKSQQQAANAIVPVPDLTRRLTVEVVPAKATYMPGDEATFAVRTRDKSGRPVPAEVSLAVVDEAIYALSPDTTPDPYGFYWGLRPNQVFGYASAPEELSGGAYQRTNAVAPVRQRFEDTAYWGPVVSTGPNGEATVTFEMPGNLTQWRATARAVTGETRVGVGLSSVVATRPLTLRLATPRIVAQGDRFTLIGTIDNRTGKAAHATASLSSTGLKLDGEPTRTVDVAAKGQAKVEWTLEAADVPAKGLATVEAHVQADGPDMADALRVTVPVVPRGVSRIAVAGGTVAQTADVTFPIRPDAITQGTYLHFALTGGLSPMVGQMAGDLLRSGRYGSPAGANMLEAISVLGPAGHRDDLKEALALLSRTQAPEGWGWWEGCSADPIITSRVLFSIALARKSGAEVYESLVTPVLSGAIAQYNRTNLWEHRALLASALAMVAPPQGLPQIAEVRGRAQNLSPYARLRMAEALARSGKADDARAILAKVAKDVSDGPSSAYLPVGDGIGWTATATDTTAELLEVLVLLGDMPELQPRLVRWLALPEDPTWRTNDEKAAVSRAIHDYLAQHPDPAQLGTATLTIGEKQYPLTPSTVDQSASVDLYDQPLSGIHIQRTGDGEAFWQATLRYYAASLDETRRGVRVARRFEVRNPAGIWTEVDRTIHPNEPVRCTVSVWGDDIDDAVKVTEPLPAGFEFVDSEYAANAREEVRDGALVHYMMNAGTPTTFRYYLRAESDGKLIALPAVAQYLRRPSLEGHSAAEEVIVGK